MTRVFFVRHAQPVFSWADDKTRPLTDEGIEDTQRVLDFFQMHPIDRIYCSPYTRSIQTIASTAEFFGKDILVDERLRERESGHGGNHHKMFQKRWKNKDYHEDGGESIRMVQTRNVAALMDILKSNEEKTVIIGTHGTALSSILNYFDPAFQCDSFLRIIDWMPYIIELDFNGQSYLKRVEHLYVRKKFKGDSSGNI